MRILAEGNGRFLEFKHTEEYKTDNALDVALDRLQYVDTHYTAVTESPPSDDPAVIEGHANRKLVVWQSPVAGSTRTKSLPTTS